MDNVKQRVEAGCPGDSQWIAFEQVEHWFTHHPPTPEQLPKYEAIREAGRRLANAIVTNAPPSADRSAAIRSVRDAVMTANAAIACSGC
jgi:hypothetical protein